MRNNKVIKVCLGALLFCGLAALHWTRNRWNAPVASLADVVGWTELSAAESLFHRLGAGNEHNRKFVSPDGHSEAVFRPSASGGEPALVDDALNLGTYNFSGPRFLYGIPHGFCDVIPYFILGNSPADMFNTSRFRALLAPPIPTSIER